MVCELGRVNDGYQDFGFESARMILGLSASNPSEWDDETYEQVEELEAAYLTCFENMVNGEFAKAGKPWLFTLRSGNTYDYEAGEKITEEDRPEDFREVQSILDAVEAELDAREW